MVNFTKKKKKMPCAKCNTHKEFEDPAVQGTSRRATSSGIAGPVAMECADLLAPRSRRTPRRSFKSQKRKENKVSGRRKG